MRARVVLSSVALAATSAAFGCQGETVLPPHGEALVVVDTDLPVPQIAGRLRVDLFAEDGRWIESRDIGRSDPRDWPASFSVYSDDDGREKRVLVRLRAYSEGAVRDYRGERFEPRSDFKPPKVASSLAELCASAPELPIGKRVKMRRGAAPITDYIAQGNCTMPNRSGSIAAKVTIPSRGRYRFSVTDAFPYESESILFLRSSCEDPSTQLACRSEPSAFQGSSGHLPRFDAMLDPGTYTLMTGGPRANWPADLTLEVDPLDAPLPSPDPIPAISTPVLTPRLVRTNADSTEDVTPESEPQPTATVDRLLLLSLKPGVRGRAQVTLRGACAGTMAKLGADPHRPDPATASTCIDQENVRAPLSPEALDSDMTRPTASAQGTFSASELCDPQNDSTGNAVCVPGGTFVMGLGQPLAVAPILALSPARIATMPRFWMDRYEVTVARFREALRKGLAIDDAAVWPNEGPLRPAPSQDGIPTFCTWSAEPRGREDYALSCVAWPAARAFCRMAGGDLPTEAQWEYAAGTAGRAFRTQFPWGDERPTCDRASFGRGVRELLNYNPCAIYLNDTPVTVGPEPVTAHDGHDGRPGDVTPLGIVNLGGGVGEWALDSAESYSAECWMSSGVRSPGCRDDNAPHRSLRGGNWFETIPPIFERALLPGAVGPAVSAYNAFAQIGFRCVYPARPNQ